MTDFPEDLFQQLYRRAPTEDDRDRLIGVKSSLGLSARDEMWPIIMTLDHYAATNQSARDSFIKETRVVIEALSKVPEEAGPIAAAEAQKAVAIVVNAAAEKIAKVAVEKSKTRADRISKRQLIAWMVIGGLVAVFVSAAAASATYFVLDAGGVCAEQQRSAQDNGDTVRWCVVERNPG